MSHYQPNPVSNKPNQLFRKGTHGIRKAALFLGITMTVAAPVSAAVEATAYTEFVRALDIIEKTQLTNFIDETPPSKEAVIEDYELRFKLVERKLDKTAPNYESIAEAERVEVMRDVLAETIQLYNDQYANYIDPTALKKYNSRRNGNFVGVGLKFRAITDDYPIVIGPITDGPMDGKDIQPADQLISVDDKSLKALKSSDVIAALKGPKGSTITVKVRRGDKTHEVKVKRSAVELHYADFELLDEGIGYIKISRFGSKTHKRVEKMLKQLLRQDATGFILDLRDNPGGSTRAARAIVSMFSKEQDIYRERYKSGATKQLPRHGKHLTNLPLAVLINSKSMSSSEIVAGAIQSYNRGTIIGSTSFGKGLVQKVFNLEAPLSGAVRTTIAMFGTPDQQWIHDTGITPDVVVETDSDFMYRRTGSLNIADNARAFQRTLLEQDVRKKHPENADEFIAAKDLQLATAINKLRQTANSTQ